MFALPEGTGGSFDIATGPDANLWIATSRGDIRRVTPQGAFTTFPLGPNERAGWLTSGPSGDIWYATFLPVPVVGKMTMTGAFTEYAVGPDTPGSIVAGADGNVWFGRQSGKTISRITPTGIVTDFALPSPMQLKAGLTLGPDGNVWFAMDGLARIAPNGTITIVHIPDPTVIVGGITAGPNDGMIWFTDPGNNRIWRYSR
jgi:virginiamycin B lyase